MMTSAPLQELKQAFNGDLITPDDARYDAARRVFNAAIDRKPALIARCADSNDVVRAVRFARDQQLPVAVRGTGHNVAGFAVCNDGLVIDLSRLNEIEVDPEERTIRVGAGCNWGEVNDALEPHGLAATGGFVSITGVSGLTLGGGLGWLVRKYGLALDNLLSADVVLAAGSLVTADSQENQDLFWAIRGGGGNFGVVTSFTFRVHPLERVLAGIVLHPVEVAEAAIRCWRDLEASAPDESTQGALLFHFPENPDAPEGLHGRPVVGLGGVYAGGMKDGEKVLRPLRQFGSPLVDTFDAIPYATAQRMADFLWPPGLYNYWKSSYLKSLSDEAIDIIAEAFRRVPSPRTVIVLEHNGDSAWDRVPASETAFGHRSWSYNLLVTSAWSDPNESRRNIEWTREVFAALEPFTAEGAYVNYLGDDQGEEGVKAAYGSKLSRLAELKAKYDPDNLFRLNHNIRPASG